jgi:hypothetical protein
MTLQQSSVRSLQIAFYNARGLRSSSNELEVFADDHDLDALLVSESKLQPGTPDPNIRGFELYRSDRTRTPGGGTAIYVRREIRHHQIALPVLQDLEATAVTINEILDPGTSVIAAGDFNAKHEAWGSRRANRNGRILIEHTDIDILIEAPPEPTYYDARDFHADKLDIALLKNVPFQTRLHASQALDSDHLPVLMHIGDEASDANRNSTVQITNWPRFAKILESDFGPVPRIESVENLESAAGAFEEKIKTAMFDSTRTRVEPQKKENFLGTSISENRGRNTSICSRTKK